MGHRFNMANWLEMVRLRSCASTLEAQPRRKQGMHLDTPSGARLFINCLWSTRVETSSHLNVFLSTFALQSVMQKKTKKMAEEKNEEGRQQKLKKGMKYVILFLCWPAEPVCLLVILVIHRVPTPFVFEEVYAV